jgi:mannose-1-phosphate guanylyltransferase
MIPALVLTAGLATRLRPLSLVRAKAALPVAGQPLVYRILRSLSAAGVRDAVLNLHHLPQTISRLVGDGGGLGLRARYSWEVPVLGSAGGPRRALPLLGAPTFLIVNGDTLTTVDLGAVIDTHRRRLAEVTMAVVPNSQPDKYGGVVLAEDDAVTGFVQVANASAFARVPDQVPYESVGALYPALIAERPGSIVAHRCMAEFFDIGTPTDYLDTSLLFAEREGNAAAARSSVTIDPSATVDRSILWDDVTIEAGVRLRECVVTDGVRVPADTSWHGVSLRVASGPLAAGERRVEHLAIASL